MPSFLLLSDGVSRLLLSDGTSLLLLSGEGAASAAVPLAFREPSTSISFRESATISFRESR